MTLHECVVAVGRRYREANRKAKKRILDGFCETTGMHRKAAIRLFHAPGKRRAIGRGRPRRYGRAVTEVLLQLWQVGDRMCGKLLQPAIPDLLQALEHHGELCVSP